MAIHCDSLEEDDEKEEGAEGEEDSTQKIPQAAAVFHEPPRRMLLRLPHSSVCVSDYLFPGETPYDSNDSVLEILGFRPNIEFMDDEVELVAAPRPQQKPGGAPSAAAAAEREALRGKGANPHGACSPAMMAGAMIAAVAA